MMSSGSWVDEPWAVGTVLRPLQGPWGLVRFPDERVLGAIITPTMGSGISQPEHQPTGELPVEDPNDTPLVRVFKLTRFLDSNIPSKNVKCKEAVGMLQKILEDNQGNFQFSTTTFTDMLDEEDEGVVNLVKAIATGESGARAKRTMSIISKQRTTIFKPSPNVQLSNHAMVRQITMDGQTVDSIFDWDYDIHQLNKVSVQTPLKSMFFAVLEGLGLVNVLKVKEDTVDNYISVIERGYRTSNPYHNRSHAADVVQATAYFCKHGADDVVLTRTEQLALVLSAAVHDVEHPGVNNSYLVNSADPLAVLYNDRSPLENHHISTAFMAMQPENHDILGQLKTDERKNFRRLMIRCVLATDMAVSFDEVGKLKNILQVGPIDVKNQVHMDQVIVMVLKMGDVSHPARAFETHYKWSQRCVYEFYEQGDMEKKELQMTPMAFMDREHDYLPKSQMGFIQFVAIPMYESVLPVFPSVMPRLIDTAKSNMERWKAYIEAGNIPVPVNKEILQTLFPENYEPGRTYAPPIEGVTTTA